jgi:hypothetical protein
MGERGREITTVKVATHLYLAYYHFHLFLHLKHLAGQKFHKDKEMKNEVTTWLCAPEAEFHDIGILTLTPRLNKYLEKDGDYVEK